MIDSHCHLDVDLFDADRDAVLARAHARGVEALVLPAVDEQSWTRVQTLARDVGAPRCFAALGIHPVALPSQPSHDDARVLDALAQAVASARPVAIGECGLDTAIDLERAPIERQERVFRAQLDLAFRHDLPVILHARGPGSYARLLDVLESARLPARGGVVHSYGGGVDLLRRFLALPLFFGFAGPATYPNARKVRASIAAVPDDRLLAETDAPDQAPEPHRPGRSEPAFVADVLRGLAAARGADDGHVRAITSVNARRLFGLP